MKIIDWLSGHSKLNAGEIKIRLVMVSVALAFFLFVAIYAQTWKFPILASLVIIGGFLIGLFRKDGGY